MYTYASFFGQVFGPLACGWVRVSFLDRATGQMTQRFFPYPDLPDDLYGIISSAAGQYEGYFSPFLYKSTENGTKANVADSVSTLWADADTCPPDKFKVPPSLVWESSPNRWHVLWKLKEPVNPEIAEDLSKRLAYAHEKYGCDTSGWDLTQLLRIPGTLNHKYDPPQRVGKPMTMAGTYPLSAFDVLPQVQNTVPVAAGGQVHPQEEEEAQQVIERYAHPNGLPFSFPEMWAKVPEQDWSGELWHIIGMCKDAGMTPEETYAVSVPCGSNKYQRDGRSDDDLWKDVQKKYNEPPKLETPQASTGKHRQEKSTRRIDLTAYLDGTYKAPEPSLGGIREDGAYLLYARKWHTVIAPNEAGKSWYALWHCEAVMLAGKTVVYCHFEEADASTTVGRLLEIGLTPDMIGARFVFLDCNEPWTKEEFKQELSRYPNLALVILDGINEACNRHGWDVEKVPGVGAYKETLVNPGTSVGAAVLSLGHPVKSLARQNERHGFGSTAWLDSADGVAFRLVPSRTPIRRAVAGSAALYSVKDRNGSVSKTGIPADPGWYYLGQFVVDDSREQFDRTCLRVIKPSADGAKPRNENVEKLKREIARFLEETNKYESKHKLEESLRARGISFDKNDLAPSLDELETEGRIERAPEQGKRARPGWIKQREGE